MKRINIHVYGLVQGVFFRYTTRKIARNLGITGIVKNLPDGSVYIEAEGPEDNSLKKVQKPPMSNQLNSNTRNLSINSKVSTTLFSFSVLVLYML